MHGIRVRVVTILSAAAFALALAASPVRAATTLDVTPAAGLAGGQTVAVSGTGLAPGAAAGWCQAVVAPEGAPPSDSWCGVAVNGTGPAGGDGSFGGPLRLHRFIYVPALTEWVDCTEGQQQCAVGAADRADIAGTGVGIPVEFAAPPPPPATRGAISLSASTDVRPDEVVTVTGSGFRVGQVVDLFQCFPGPGAPSDPSSCGLLRDSVTADDVGAFAVGLPVRQTVLDAPAIAGQGGTTYDCLAAPSGPCRVVAAEAVDFPGTAVAAPVSLAPPLPVITPGVKSQAEGNSGSAPLEVPVVLSSPSTETVTVQWATLFEPGAPGAQADPATDYTPASGTVTFAPGDTAETVSIEVNGDTLVEPDEYIVVSFDTPTNATLADDRGTAGITNDDRATVVPGAAAEVEGDSGTNRVDVPVILTNPSTQTVTVQWTTVFVPGAPAGQADPATDYAPVGGTITFAPGDTTGTATIDVIGDTVVEPDEYIVVLFGNATNARMGGFWGLGFGGAINDD